MKAVRLSLTIDQELHAEMLGYCSGIDRTVQNFLVHAARQYMRRYPLERQTSGKKDRLIPEVHVMPFDGKRLLDRSQDGAEKGGQ